MYTPQYADDDKFFIIDKQTGESQQWIKLSARIREFNRMYPKSGGYKVRITMVNPGQILGPELVGLYQAVLMAGHKPQALDLPALRITERVFIAQLLDTTDTVIAEASACGMVHKYKDHETIESAAMQRLLASLGMPGTESSLDSDEARDIAAIRDNPSMEDPVELGADTAMEPSGEGQVAVVTAPDTNGTAAPAVLAGSVEAATAPAEQPRDARPPPKSAPAWKGKASTSKGMDKAEALDRQIQNMQRAYAARGMTPPDVGTREDVATAMRALKVSPAEAAVSHG